MDTQQIINELEAERDRLDHVIKLLRGDSAKMPGGRRRHLSAAAKRRISEAMTRTWALRKKKGPQAA